jgi:hypothetical protein
LYLQTSLPFRELLEKLIARAEEEDKKAGPEEGEIEVDGTEMRKDSEEGNESPAGWER